MSSEPAQRPVPPVADDAAGAKAPADDQGSCLEFLLAQRHMSNAAVLAGLVAVIGIAFCLFHLYAAYFGQGESYLHNTIHVALVMVLCFILKPLGRSTWKDPLNGWFLVDLLCIGLVIAVQVYTGSSPRSGKASRPCWKR